MGPAQVEWLKAGLAASRATWKVIAADMPLGLIVGDGTGRRRDATSSRIPERRRPGAGTRVRDRRHPAFDQAQRRRERDLVDSGRALLRGPLLRPARAQFKDFKPFWEFVAGPLNAGTFGPNALDNTFGPKVVFTQQPGLAASTSPPTEGGLYFGHVRIDVANAAMVMDMLRRVASETGLTVIATLHHVEYARRYADRVLGFRPGRLVWDGPAGRPDRREARTRSSDERPRPRRSAASPAAGEPRAGGVMRTALAAIVRGSGARGAAARPLDARPQPRRHVRLAVVARAGRRGSSSSAPRAGAGHRQPRHLPRRAISIRPSPMSASTPGSAW